MATQKVHFVTGKGGVGKSIFAVAYSYALSAAHRQKKASKATAQGGPILLAELNDKSFYQHYLGLQSVGYTPQTLSGLSNDIDICLWNTQDCLREYALHLLKLETLYKLFFTNPVSKALINVAPGLQELSLLGKATSGVRKHGPPLDYSEIVIDAFSTGHFLSLLRAPRALSEVISFGPMAEQSKQIDKWIRNPEFCHIHLVTLPELLPITEAIELFKTLEDEFGIRAHVYVNKVWGVKDSDIKKIPDSAKNFFQEKILEEKESFELLKKKKIAFSVIPFFPTLNTFELIKEIAEKLPEKLPDPESDLS